MRIYLDVCCLNRPFDDQRQERVRREAEAVLTILRRVEAGGRVLNGSEVVDFEIGRIVDRERRQRVEALAGLAAINLRITHAIRTRAKEWTEQGLKPVDALHLACAEAVGVDVFLTTDDRLLRVMRRPDLARVPVNNPLPWLNEVLS